MNLFFMDERICKKTESATITGVIVPIEKYRNVREEFYELLKWAIRGEDNVISWPPELRGSTMPDAWSKEQILKTFSDVADLVCRHELSIVRVGYKLTKQYRNMHKTATASEFR